MSRNIIRKLGHHALQFIRAVRKYQYTKSQTHEIFKTISNRKVNQKFIYYLGVARHSNLGDMAQLYCIRNWINENYPEYTCIEIETDTVVDIRFNFINLFKKFYTDKDRIIFQSGYTTQDLGGSHDVMHRIICENFRDARILMMPQTVFFKNQTNQEISSKSYSKARNMLFLARDAVSYEMAKGMFPKLRTDLYPDIVTTLIGNYHFNNNRDGICLCLRNDGEKFYSDEDLDSLKRDLAQKYNVDQIDTTIRTSAKVIIKNLQSFIERQIEYFSHFKVVITDRYHGTILALAAGTPVIILKTTDHKVVTGADWFKGKYDGQISIANDLKDAEKSARRYMESDDLFSPAPYFKEKYYDHLKTEFERF